jgi:hypothetical protein
MTPEEIAAQLDGLNYREDLHVVRNRFFLVFKGSDIGSFDMTSWADPVLRNAIHVPGLRGNPSRTYPATA